MNIHYVTHLSNDEKDLVLLYRLLRRNASDADVTLNLTVNNRNDIKIECVNPKYLNEDYPEEFIETQTFNDFLSSVEYMRDYLGFLINE